MIGEIQQSILDYNVSCQMDMYQQNEDLLDAEERQILQRLPRARYATFASDTHKTCLQGTRSDILSQLEIWADADLVDALRAYWLNGHAGSGKSTIAKSFCQRLFANGRLTGSFFCSRDFTDRSDIRLIFPTLAYQLACQFPSFRKVIVELLTTRPDIAEESLQNQLTHLLVVPLKSTGIKTVIAIDALDECKDDEPASAILSLLARCIDDLPHVKFFITGRPEAPIRAGFRLPSLRSSTDIFLLHDVDKISVDQDIKMYFSKSLNAEGQRRSHQNLSEDWLSDHHLSVLTEKACGLFIFAATAVSFITSRFHLPEERLELVTGSSETTLEGRSGIDSLYTKILLDGYREMADDTAQLESFREIWGLIVLSANPLSIEALSTLLDCSPSKISNSLQCLHSVLHIQENPSEPIRIHHKSFPDFITDPSRCSDPRFLVDPALHHTEIVIRCFRLIQETLSAPNICGLPPYSMNAIMDLGERRQNIGKPLEYACRFWAIHLKQIVDPGIYRDRLLELLEDFVKDRQIFWLEVLSLIEDLRTAVVSLNVLREWIRRVCEDTSTIIPWIEAGQTLIWTFFEPVEESALHIYHSALLLTKDSSLFWKGCREFVAKGAKLVNRLGGCPNTAVVKIIPTKMDPNALKSVVFSHDGTRLGVVGTDARIFNAVTGQRMATLSEEKTTGTAILFSADDTWVLTSWTSGAISSWDIDTGGRIRYYLAHQHSVTAIALSHNQQFLLSGDSSGQIRIWSDTGEKLHVLETHSPVRRLHWMPEDTSCLSYACDKLARIWNVSSLGSKHSAIVMQPEPVKARDVTPYQSGHAYILPSGGSILLPNAPSLSPKDIQFDSILATSSHQGYILLTTNKKPFLLDPTKQGEIELNFNAARQAICAAFSPDGRTIVFGSRNGLLSLWRLSDASEDSFPITCLSVSDDGNLVASGTAEGEIKLENAETDSQLYRVSPMASRGEVQAIAISPNNQFLSWISTGNLHTCSADIKQQQCYSMPFLSSSNDSSKDQIQAFVGLSYITNASLVRISARPTTLVVTSGKMDIDAQKYTMLAGGEKKYEHSRRHGTLDDAEYSTQPLWLQRSRWDYVNLHYIPWPGRERASYKTKVEGWLSPVVLDSDNWVLGKGGSKILWLPYNMRPSTTWSPTMSWSRTTLFIGGQDGVISILRYEKEVSPSPSDIYGMAGLATKEVYYSYDWDE
ncbi:hypothetical protein B0H34DRAFT_262867 [Crassisporium funariophilum]|nr:hypothetical protein B0H34DRAFT_262867 [Crassisporium funariophilum]